MIKKMHRWVWTKETGMFSNCEIVDMEIPDDKLDSLPEYYDTVHEKIRDEHGKAIGRVLLTCTVAYEYDEKFKLPPMVYTPHAIHVSLFGTDSMTKELGDKYQEQYRNS
jgi:hypothetical protein